MIFVDTGAWAAFFVPRDPSHGAAVEWMEHNEQLLITTDYILDELLTLLKMRYSVAAAVQAGNQLWREQYSRVLYMPPADIHEAWRLFQSHHDKGWSFTDCTSYAAMKRLRISQAFAFDRHFSQMPGIRRVPPTPRAS